MIPVEAGEPLCGALVQVAEGSGALMERHIGQLKKISNNHIEIDWKTHKVTGEYRFGEMHSSWGRIDYQVSYEPHQPASNGVKITLVRIDVWGSGLGKRHIRGHAHDAARAVILRFLFPKADQGSFMELEFLPD